MRITLGLVVTATCFFSEPVFSETKHSLDDEYDLLVQTVKVSFCTLRYQALLESLDTIRTEPDDVAKKFGIDIPSTPALRSGPAAMALVQHGRLERCFVGQCYPTR